METGSFTEYQQLLEKMKSDILVNIEQLSDEIDMLRDDDDDFRDFDDAPTRLRDEIDHIALLKQQRAELDEINHALAKIQNGTYGICEISGRKIRPARLQVEPQARYCMEEAEKLESEG